MWSPLNALSCRDVNVTGISQIARRVLLVNITATLGVDLPVKSSQDAIQAELAVKNLSADDAIDMLSSQPDRFLGRTTKVRIVVGRRRGGGVSAEVVLLWGEEG